MVYTYLVKHPLATLLTLYFYSLILFTKVQEIKAHSDGEGLQVLCSRC
jgi:hypothetical protein